MKTQICSRKERSREQRDESFMGEGSRFTIKKGKINLDTMSRLEKSQNELQQQSDKVRKLEKTVDEYKQKIKHMNDQHKKELEDAKRPEKKRRISENEDSKQSKGQSTSRRDRSNNKRG